MASWNVGPSRLNGVDNGLLDLKALLNQAIGGGLGSSLGSSLGNSGGSNVGLNTAVGSATNRGGGMPRIGGGGGGGGPTSGGGGGGGGVFGNPGGMLDGSGLNSSFGNGAGSVSNSSNGSAAFFDPFASMSTFGFFNPKDPSGNMQMQNSCNQAPGSGMGGGGGGSGGGGGNSGANTHHLNAGMGSHSSMMRNGQSKSPTSYHSGGGGGGGNVSHNSHSPAFPSSHSPTFFGGSSSNHQSNHYGNSSSNFGSPSASKFPISTFSIDDTLSGRNNDNSSVFGSSSDNNDMSQSNGHGNHYGNGSNSHSNNYQQNQQHHGNRSGGDRDNNHSSNTFHSGSGGGSSGSHSNTRSGNNEGDNSFNQGVRETGIIEKLLHSYGFIQCCERQARLFFHFSQFEGTIEHLKLGDPVEFEMTYDRRTGKPIASAVTKIGPEVVLSEERVTGTVTTELHHESNGELQGRISYENRGECFFLPYCQEDIEGNVSLRSGDTVSFQIATNQRSGNLTARYVRLENPARPVRYKGIVSSIKDNFGFIERADVAKEIFFHFSETRIHEGIVVGDNVEFNIQTRNGKEVACSITKLPSGTVVFEDIGNEILKGQVLKPIDKSQPDTTAVGPTPRSETMQGRLRYRGPDRQEMEVAFGEKDQKGSFTMKHGDWVQFQLAVDRRDKQQRATNIALLEESFVVSGERREEGVISAVKDGCGFATCAERDSKMFFRFTEMLDFTRSPKIGDDIEFTIIQDATSPVRQSAIRIKYLKPGAVQFEIPVSQGINGLVVREPSTPWVSQEALAGILPSLATLGLPKNVTDRLIQGLSSQEVLSQITGSGNDQPGEPGLIQYQLNGWQQETITFHWKDCKNLKNIRVGTKIIFDIHQVRRNRELVAANIRAHDDPDSDSESGSGVGVNPPVQLPSSISQQQGLSYHQLAGALSSSPTGMHNTLTSTGLGSPTSSRPFSGSSSPPEVRHDSLGGLPSGISSYLANGIDKFSKPDQGLMDSPTWSEMTGSKDTDSQKDLVGAECSDLLSNGLSRYDHQFNTSEGSVSSSPSSSVSSTSKNPRVVMKGYIAALKDGFGFIETMAQDGEIFFHSSSLVGDFAALEVGQEVEYVVSSKASANGKNAADIVKPLPKGSIGRAAIFPDILQGVVSRPLRGANPDQSEYTGIIDGQDGHSYNFGIISMLNKKETLQAGEGVEFQLDAQGKAVNIRAVRKKLRATVEAVKGTDGRSQTVPPIPKICQENILLLANFGLRWNSLAFSVCQYGFLSHELEDGKKLFFHMSEVKDHQHLNPGDEVEFVILQNPRNGKSSACSVVKVGESQRPERLLNRLSKLSVDESAPRLVVVRQPYGPDGTKGFTQPRVPRKPGSIVTARESTSSAGSLN